MFRIDISDFERAAKRIAGAERQMPFLMAVALTDALKDAREAEYATMQSVFDRPTRFALNSLQVVPAKKGTLEGELRPKEFGRLPAWRYLGPHVTGGTRSQKSFERALQRAGILGAGQFAIPAPTTERDAFGNVRGGLITRILSAIQANPDEMQNTRWKARKVRGARKRPQRYYAIRDVGIFERVARGAPSRPVFFFTSRVQYRKRFPYYETAERAIPPAFRRGMERVWERYVVRPMKAAA